MTTNEAIKFANDLKNNYTIDLSQMEDFCNMAISALEQQKWILCSERVPDTDENELVVDAYVGRTIAWHTEAGNWLDLYDYQISDVVAWMPLPDPYKESVTK